MAQGALERWSAGALRWSAALERCASALELQLARAGALVSLRVVRRQLVQLPLNTNLYTPPTWYGPTLLTFTILCMEGPHPAPVVSSFKYRYGAKQRMLDHG
jgi:hypothetical protein